MATARAGSTELGQCGGENGAEGGFGDLGGDGGGDQFGGGADSLHAAGFAVGGEIGDLVAEFAEGRRREGGEEGQVGGVAVEDAGQFG